MDYIVVFVIILLSILVIIQVVGFKFPTIKWDKKTSDEPKCKTLADGTIFCTGLEDVPKCKFNPLDATEISAISEEQKASPKTDGVNYKKADDYYYLRDPKESQVYHVFENIYTFEEAGETCQKRGGRLATPEELKKSMEKDGAGWCSWGWAGDEDAYLPNVNPACNKETGLLSGKNLDPYLRVGANCYGVPSSLPKCSNS
jgi:hypothetical protein